MGDDHMHCTHTHISKHKTPAIILPFLTSEIVIIEHSFLRHNRTLQQLVLLDKKTTNGESHRNGTATRANKNNNRGKISNGTDIATARQNEYTKKKNFVGIQTKRMCPFHCR